MPDDHAPVDRAYNTAQIVDAFADATGKAADIPAYAGDFDTWKAGVEARMVDIAAALPPGVARSLPLRDDVLKLVAKKLYGVMPFSREYVLKKYQRERRGKHHLVYPAHNPRSLRILFSGFMNRITYNRYSWYFDEKEEWAGDTAYLFLNDPSLHWYVGADGTDDVSIYSEIIEGVIAETGVPRQRVYTIGASMGGYASLLYGMRLGLGGSISVHPQLSYKASRRYERNNWETKLRECGGNFYDVDDLVAKAPAIPPIYLECGDHPADIHGLDSVVAELSARNATFTVHRPRASAHDTTSPSRERIETILSFFERFSKS